MTFAIAAAGTGGHVFPGLAVGEALVEGGVAASAILFIGGDRLEAVIYPKAGFPFLAVELRGLQRSLTPRNLTLPGVVLRARDRITEPMRERRVAVALGMGGYVTIPTALAARRVGLTLMIAEQNAGAGLANRVSSRWASSVFTSFPETHGLADAEWVGNPVRRGFRDFDRLSLRPRSLLRYSLSDSAPVIGVFGGSLGAAVLNQATQRLVESWGGGALQILHLTGERDFEQYAARSSTGKVDWRRVAFEEEMEHFYAAADLVVARAGGAVAEITATSTPSILVPGGFGSAGHQGANAGYLERAGAAVVVQERDLGQLEGVVASLTADGDRLASMRLAAARLARPDAAVVIASRMMEAVPR